MKTQGLDEDVSRILHDRLVRLGDMLGDGLADEPGGREILREYKEVARKLGYGPSRGMRTARIDAAMEKALKTQRCKCGGKLVQARKGALRAQCGDCHTRYQFAQKSQRGRG